MLEAFVITLREGIEGVLIVAILLTYLGKIGRNDLRGSVFWGVALAIGGSVVGAVALTRLPVNQEAFEGVVLLVAAVFVGSMIVWMWKHARHVKREIESGVQKILAEGGSISWGLLLFTFLMIFREGVETVIFLSAVSLNTDALLSFLGGLLGLALAVAFGVAFVKGAIRVNLGRFFTVTGIVLLILVAQLLIGGVHELGEAGWIPVGPGEMALIGPIVKNNSLFVIAILLLPLIVVMMSEAGPLPRNLDGAERRMELARARRERLWKSLASVAGMLVIVALTLNFAYSEGPKTVTPPIMVSASGSRVEVPISQLKEGELARYGFDIDGTVVRFLLLKAADGTVATALDACEICGAFGYVQEGPSIICINCVADIYAPTIGMGGGCNPIPLEARVEDGKVLVDVGRLTGEKERFSR